MPELKLDNPEWRSEGVLDSDEAGGDDDPAAEIGRTQEQGFGEAGGETAGEPVPGAHTETGQKRGRGRPKKPPSATPGEKTKSVRVELPLSVYSRVKMQSWQTDQSPGAIIAELVASQMARTE